MLTSVFDRLRPVIVWGAALALSGCVSINVPTADQPPPDEPEVVAEDAGQEGELSDEQEPEKGPEEDAGPVSADPGDAGSTPEPDPDEDADADASSSWETVTKETSSGIARLTVVGCDPSVYGSGSGFLVAPDLMVTAAHVVDEAITTTVAVDGEVRDAMTLGIDDDADVALLLLDRPLDGAHVFSWPDDEVGIGTDIAALGFPYGGDLSINSGTLSSIEQREGLEWVRISADVNPGNSGGPVITRSGDVVGIVSHGYHEINGRPANAMSYALSHATARPLVDEWAQSPDRPATPECVTETDPSEVAVDGDVSDPEVAFALLTLLVHGDAINQGSYDSAYAIFTPRMQEAMGGVEAWSSGLHSSYWTELTLTDSTVTQGGVTLRVALRTEQAPEDGPDGQSCSDWDLTYDLVRDGDTQELLIDKVTSHSDPVGC